MMISVGQGLYAITKNDDTTLVRITSTIFRRNMEEGNVFRVFEIDEVFARLCEQEGILRFTTSLEKDN